ncbi:MAG: hypothetical protein K8S18_01585 [Desulfobacula sp.]|nr:hypothetical protein [Desulfobacula sp.]
MQIGKVITYPEIFGPIPDGLTTGKLTEGIPSITLIHYFSFINSVNFLKPNEISIEKWILKKIIDRFEGIEKYILLHQFKKAIVDSKRPLVTLFPLKSILLCIIQEFENFTTGNFESITKEEELSILKRILLQNQLIDKESTEIIGRIDKKDPDGLFKLLWPIQFPNSEFLERKRIYFALYKAIFFFEFIESFEKFKPSFPEFFNTFSSKSSLDFIKNILLLLKNGQFAKTKNFTSYFPNNYDDINPLIKEFTINLDSKYKPNKADYKDFKIFRKTPIIKFQDDSLSVTNWNFVLDKFYPAVIYDFFNKTSVKTLYQNSKGETPINNYLADIGKHFAEQQMFNNLIIKALKRKQCILQTGDEITKTFDLYFRIDRHIILIEFKNISLPKKATYDEIKNLIDTKFVSENGQNKGILQLVAQIKKFQTNPELFEDFERNGVNKNRVVIYPLIIYTDNSLRMYGVNSYLNKLFREEIKKINPKLRFRVQDLVFISFDFFLDSYTILKRKKVDPVFLLNYYYRRLFKKRKISLSKKKNPVDLHLTFEEIV